MRNQMPLPDPYKMPHKKQHLPSKTCKTCNRPFVWRKKWEKNWEAVRYCSERCRREKITEKTF
jgi:hypothetical protein